MKGQFLIMSRLNYLRSRVTGRLSSLPVLVLMPHSRCNCKCVMCDIWKANHNKREIAPEDLAVHIDAFRRLGVKWVLLSGGEPLMHSNLWSFCRSLKQLDVRITILSTGLLLEANASEICASCDDVIVSLDGSREVHNSIRTVSRAYEAIEDGVRAIKEVDGQFRITGRCVIQRANYRDILNVVEAAHTLKLDGISFLAADVSSNAFNRPVAWSDERVSEIALSAEQAGDLERLIEQLITQYGDEIRSGFIVESPQKLRKLPAYFSAINGLCELPSNRCNAPWVSAVVEADGEVRPCFFHRPFGNIYETQFDDIINGPQAVSFRKNLSVERDPICQKCVCTLQFNSFE
jgi:MoaA/NifB/PqqE/SkfB family radical SAM enzyme